MDINRLKYLTLVAEYGSFSKAASVIGIAQPALGRHMRKLEEECHVPLLYRNGRGVILTPQGEKLLERVEPLIKQMEEAVGELTAEQREPSGFVTIGLTPTLCRLVGIELLLAVQEKFPQVSLNIVSAYSGYVHEWLVDARVDLAVVHDARRSPHIAVEEVGSLPLSLISSRSSLSPAYHDARIIPFGELNGVPLVLPTKNHGLRRTVEYAASEEQVSLDIRYEIDAMELMIQVVRRGLAHTVLFAPVMQLDNSGGQFVTREIRSPGISTKLMLAKAANRPMTRAIRAVEGCVKQVLSIYNSNT